VCQIWSILLEWIGSRASLCACVTDWQADWCTDWHIHDIIQPTCRACFSIWFWADLCSLCSKIGLNSRGNFLIENRLGYWLRAVNKFSKLWSVLRPETRSRESSNIYFARSNVVWSWVFQECSISNNMFGSLFSACSIVPIKGFYWEAIKIPYMC